MRSRRERLNRSPEALNRDDDETERKCKVLQAAPGKDGTAITGSCRPKSGASTATTPVANADFRTRRAGMTLTYRRTRLAGCAWCSPLTTTRCGTAAAVMIVRSLRLA